jgi:hypothetical protein
MSLHHALVSRRFSTADRHCACRPSLPIDTADLTLLARSNKKELHHVTTSAFTSPQEQRIPASAIWLA